jgi:hypothetical protein
MKNTIALVSGAAGRTGDTVAGSPRGTGRGVSETVMPPTATQSGNSTPATGATMRDAQGVTENILGSNRE